MKNHCFLKTKTKNAPNLCDAGNLVPVFYKSWKLFDTSVIDWGSVSDYIKYEGFYVFGGRLHKDISNKDIYCI